VLDSSGCIDRVVVFSREITENRKAEETLQRYRLLARHARDMVLFIRYEDGAILEANAAAAEAYGYTIEQLKRMTIHDLRETGTRPLAPGEMARAAMQGILFESLHQRADGSVFPVEVSSQGANIGGTRTLISIIRDITPRKQAEEALLRSEKLASVGRMAATIAHEINNPLEAVTNLLFLVRGIGDLPEPARQYLEMADAEVRRIAHITRQSLGFYREFSTPALISVDEVLESAINLLKNKIAAKQAVIQKQWDKGVQITAIAGELRQVFTNLLANSLEAIAETGIITLRVSPSLAPNNGKPCVRITIADSGCGIGPTAQEHIFEPFFTTKGALGTGLGLWVSRQIVDKHGGTIRLRSSTDEKHRGTVFSIIFPAEHGRSAGVL
jgi:PAS domain S-box-containing protein